MNVDRFIVIWGRALLVFDSIWTVYWLVTGIIEALTNSPIPPVLISGLPLSAYDLVAEYLAAHIGMALHFLLSGSMFLLAAAGGEEIITAWYMLPLGAVVAKDLFAVMERYLHLSRDAYPVFFVFEASLAISGLSISVLAFAWFQAVYWRLILTGKRFDREYAAYLAHKRGDGDGDGDIIVAPGEDESRVSEHLTQAAPFRALQGHLSYVIPHGQPPQRFSVNHMRRLHATGVL